MRASAFVSPIVLFAVATILGCSTVSTELDAKLAAQFDRYVYARNKVLERVNNSNLPVEQRVVTRTEFEEWLSLPKEFTLTTEDLSELSKRHRAAVASARDSARSISQINLDFLRRLKGNERVSSIAKFCAAFPKGAMLHVHPSGSFPREALAKVFRGTNPTITPKEIVEEVAKADSGLLLYPQELSWLKSLPETISFLSFSDADQERLLAMTRLPEGSHPFERFDVVFYFLNFPFTDPNKEWQNFETLLQAFAERAAREHVRYVELTTGANPQTFHLKRAMLERISKVTGVKFRINVSFSRWDTLENQRKIADYVLNLKEPTIAGIDLLANENQAPALERGQVPYARVMHEVKNGTSGLHRTMHAGELGDGRNPRDAMILGAERLGHGVKLALDPVATEYARRTGVAIEANITSNQKLGVFDEVGKHPFLEQLRLGIPVSLSTDDEGIFDTDINTECEKVVGLSDVQYSEMRAMTLNSVRTSFLAEKEKAELLSLIESDLASFEQNWALGKTK